MDKIERMEQVYYYKKEHMLFPKRLEEIPSAPKGIYAVGSLPDPNKPSVAIIGARMCSPYGKRQAIRFAQELSDQGVQIISGLAKGVDGYAHLGALDAGGKTFAVMGCGPDICYPTQHRELRRRILETGGGILSEYGPGEEPLAWHFPMRNRLISALADIVLVIEARVRSGSLITVEWALEQGKTVYALPGRVDDVPSDGCNRLIAQGAGIAYSPEALMKELSMDLLKIGENKEKKYFKLAKEEKLVYSCLDFEPQNLDDILDRTRIPLARLMELLLTLELDGYVSHCGQNLYMKAK